MVETAVTVVMRPMVESAAMAAMAVMEALQMVETSLSAKMQKET